MYECIVFDLDGTLLDTLEDLADSVNFALQKNGLQLRTIEEVRSFVGNGIKNLMERAVGAENQEHAEQALKDFKAHYKLHCADKTKAYDGIIPLLKQLKARGIALAVLSNKADFAVKDLAKRYFGDLLDEAMGENESAGIRKKPAPDALFSLVEKLGKDKNKTLYVGDSEVDIQTANNANMPCISVTWGFKDKEFLMKNGATHYADTPQDILKFIE